MSGHTPGPWKAEDKLFPSGNCLGQRIGNDEENVCEALYADEGDKSAKANARLIAAAPELFAIARRFVALPSGAWHPERHAADEAELLTDALAAIAKATGATP